MVVLAQNDGAEVAARSYTATELLAHVGVASAPLVVADGSTSIVEADDAEYERQTGATVDTNAQIQSSVPVLSIDNLDATVATVDESGYISRVSNGTARINVRTKLGTARFNVALARQVDQVDTWQRYLDGTLGKHFAEQIWGRVAGVTPSVAKPMYSAYPVRNPQCWCFNGSQPIDVTCIAHGSGTSNRNGTCITRRAVIHAAHYQYAIGATINFVAMDGTLVSATVVDRRALSLDIAIAKLSSDLPASITPASLMPDDLADYLPGVANSTNDPTTPAPVCTTERHGYLLTTDLNFLGRGVAGDNNLIIYADGWLGTKIHDESLPLNQFGEDGDSGSGVYAVLNNRLVVLGSLFGNVLMTAYNTQLTAIQAALTSMSAGTLEIADLSAFTNFGD